MASLAALGLTNDEIAEKLYISPVSVSRHLCYSYKAMGYPTVRGVQRVRLTIDYWKDTVNGA